MNKRECINYIRKEHEKAHEELLRRMRNKEQLIYEAITECYEHCKQTCSDNGYVGKCFIELWNRATKENARESGVHA